MMNEEPSNLAEKAYSLIKSMIFNSDDCSWAEAHLSRSVDAGSKHEHDPNSVGVSEA